MNKKTFEALGYSQIMQLQTWNDILRPLIPMENNARRFFKQDSELLSNVIRFYLNALGYPCSLSLTARSLPFGQFTELQATVEAKFVLIRIVGKRFDSSKNRFIEDTIAVGCKVWYINQLEDLLSKLDYFFETLKTTDNTVKIR